MNTPKALLILGGALLGACIVMVAHTGGTILHASQKAAAINVGQCRSPGATTHDCVMQTSRCTFIVGTENPLEPLASATNCIKPEYSDPCAPQWSEFRKAIARDRGLDIICRTGT